MLFVGVKRIKAQEGTQADPRRPLSPEKTTSESKATFDLPYFSPKEPIGCEVFLLYLEDALMRVQTAPNSYLIIIARLGDGENSGRLNTYRLKLLDNYLSRWRPVKYITAEGKKVKGYGRIEIYVGGKLLYEVPFKKGDNLKSFCS